MVWITKLETSHKEGDRVPNFKRTFKARSLNESRVNNLSPTVGWVFKIYLSLYHLLVYMVPVQPIVFCGFHS